MGKDQEQRILVANDRLTRFGWEMLRDPHVVLAKSEHASLPQPLWRDIADRRRDRQIPHPLW
jgi:hypothetical protein